MAGVNFGRNRCFDTIPSDPSTLTKVLWSAQGDGNLGGESTLAETKLPMSILPPPWAALL